MRELYSEDKKIIFLKHLCSKWTSIITGFPISGQIILFPWLKRSHDKGHCEATSCGKASVPAAAAALPLRVSHICLNCSNGALNSTRILCAASAEQAVVQSTNITVFKGTSNTSHTHASTHKHTPTHTEKGLKEPRGQVIYARIGWTVSVSVCRSVCQCGRVLPCWNPDIAIQKNDWQIFKKKHVFLASPKNKTTKLKAKLLKFYHFLWK